MQPAYLVGTQNLLDGTETYSLGSDIDAAEPTANLYDLDITSFFEVVIGATPGNSWIEVDRGAGAPTFDIAFVAGHTMSSGVTVKVLESATPTGDELLATFTHQTRHMYVDLSGSKRYVRFDFTKSGTETFDIGQLGFGTKTLLSATYTEGYVPGLRSEDNELLSTHGVPRRENLYDEVAEFEWPWRQITTAERDEIKALWQAAKGRQNPLLLIPDHPNAPCEWVYIDAKRFLPKNVGAGAWDLDMRFVGAPLGIRIGA